MKVVEMCCGYGGASAGMLAAGLEIEASYDLWPVAVEQHRLWHPEVPCEVRDVATITPEELRGRLVWASLPCQPWSTANIHAHTRGKNHPHYYSLAHFARQVQHARAALIENVPGLVWTREGRAELKELERECARLGLTHSIHLVYSHWFGVAQARRRVFILIGRDLPLVLIQAGMSPAELHPSVTTNPNGENLHSSKRVMPAVMTKPFGGKNKAYRTGVHANEREVNPNGRSLELRAELQGCPVPQGVTATAASTLIGNLVPPKLAQAIAEQVFMPLLPQAVPA